MILQGDCLIKLKELEDNSVDSIVTDPPYELGFMGKSWDNTGIANNKEMWAECLRVLKPGGHLLAFSGTRTYHRMAVAIEDAGFEVRDMIEWVYGSGFPKSLNIGKVIDKSKPKNQNDISNAIQKSGLSISEIARGCGVSPQLVRFWIDNERTIQPLEIDKLNKLLELELEYTEDLREEIGVNKNAMSGWNMDGTTNFKDRPILKGTSENAKQWEGWGTSLKPSHEPVICCAKPLTLELIFAKMGIDITNNLVNLCQKYNVNVKDVESSLNSILLKLEKVGVNTVAENARMCDWENIESVVIAGMSFTSPKPISKEPPEGYKVVSAPVSANQNGNEYLQENGTLIGTAEDLSEQMDILLSTLATRNIDLNTVWLWKSILENVLQKAGTFTTSMALKTTIAWKTCKSLLSVNTQNFTSKHNSTSPAHEPICMARKPLAEKTVAENCLKYGTGGINIDESRVEMNSEDTQKDKEWKEKYANGRYTETGWKNTSTNGLVSEIKQGRFPANLIHDNSEEVRECFPEANHKTGSSKGAGFQDSFVGGKADGGIELPRYNDSGNASRFFKSIVYVPKASKSERNKGCEGLEEKEYPREHFSSERLNDLRMENEQKRNPNTNNHPTVKPIALMEYLIKMVTPKGGIVLDPFAGSGSTLVAAKQNGFKYIGIEMTEEYIPIIEARLNGVDNTLF